jgi:hypothetical protein
LISYKESFGAERYHYRCFSTKGPFVRLMSILHRFLTGSGAG